MRQKLLFLFFMIFISTGSLNAQKGLFIKFSLGPGYTSESSNINSSGMSIATKNHAIGWGFNEKYAVYIGEFGGLNKIKVDNYNYINLDTYGIGFSYLAPIDIKFSITVAYSKVSLAENWWEPLGEDAGNGVAFNMSIDKEWLIAKRWGVRLGPQAFFLKTIDTDYKFFNVSINGSLVFYLKQVW